MKNDCKAAIIRLKRHDGEYRCGFCAFGSKEKLNLLEHYKSLHNVELKSCDFPAERLQEMINTLKLVKGNRRAIKTTDKAIQRKR